MPHLLIFEKLKMEQKSLMKNKEAFTTFCLLLGRWTHCGWCLHSVILANAGLKQKEKKYL